MQVQRLVAAGVPLAAAGIHGRRAPATCAAAEPHRGLPPVDVRLHAHQLLFGRFLLAAAEEVRRSRAGTCGPACVQALTQIASELMYA